MESVGIEEGGKVDGCAGVRVARAVHAERSGSECCCDGQVLDERDDDELVVSSNHRQNRGVTTEAKSEMAFLGASMISSR